MSLPPSFSATAARAAGLTRGQLRGPRFIRLTHDLTVRLDDAIDERERLLLLAGVLPADAAFSHGTAAAMFGAPSRSEIFRPPSVPDRRPPERSVTSPRAALEPETRRRIRAFPLPLTVTPVTAS